MRGASFANKPLYVVRCISKGKSTTFFCQRFSNTFWSPISSLSIYEDSRRFKPILKCVCWLEKNGTKEHQPDG